MPKKMKINNNIFIGNNDLSSRNLFLSRVIYSAYAYQDHPDAVADSIIRDFWRFENVYYGKVDLKFNPQEVDPAKLVQLANHPEHYTLPFVKDAFEAFEKDVKVRILSGAIKDFPILRKLKVTGSTLSASKKYGGLGWYAIKVLRYLIQSGKINNIKNFDDFMEQFEDISLEYSQNNVLTKSSFIMSSDVNVAHSGLALDLFEGDFSRDSSKVSFFISHKEFPVYLELLRRYGFYVDKAAPWRIVANLSSFPMQQYIQARGLSGGLAAVFNRYYQKVHLTDISYLQKTAYDAYMTIATKRPILTEISVQGGEFVATKTRRPRIVPQDMARHFSHDRWLQLYIKIKNNEKRLKFTDKEMDKFIADAIKLQKIVDKREVLGYINSVFRDVPALEGSSNDFMLRKKFKNVPKDQLPFSDYRKFLSDTAKGG